MACLHSSIASCRRFWKLNAQALNVCASAVGKTAMDWS